MRAGPYIASNIDNALAVAGHWRSQGNSALALQYERDAVRWAAGTDYVLPPGIGDDPIVAVPRELLRRVYDAIEEIEGRGSEGSPTWTLAEQLDVLLNPKPATPWTKSRSWHCRDRQTNDTQASTP